ncbi:FhaA domain-containing protein [Amnibacterium kyonggiense]|uniref:Uncharacterized protein DUF2662 n=1 Tax=Amnibacterium kyonggiense TaxID=595671 RepID=A0A4R7FHR9_9MICO|nr:FhaA domain-containing protein [Amnibacterium kyonggiense]TDS74867.1 uncharacterized protein DUF2662 [Amnibacterium kyonggiense]
MGWLWLGLLIGLLVGAAAVALVLRAVGRLTGTDRRSIWRLVVDGLTPGRRREGVAAQRALARRLKRAGERTASGRRVAAEELLVHVSPEDHETITSALGIETAETDLAEFYRGHAARGKWLVGAEPQVRIVRDISLRPRQVFVRTTTRAAPAGTAAAAAPAAARAPAASRQAPRPSDDAPTDVLPRGGDPDATTTAVYPAGLLLGDLVVVHGTDVRTVTPADGVLRIGRGAHNDLVLERPGIVRDHLVLEVRDDGWWAVPGATQGGTKLDGAVLDGPAPIRGTAVLELGRGVRVRVSVEPT